MDPSQVVRDSEGVMRCTECGFQYSLSPERVTTEARVGLVEVGSALAGVPKEKRAQRSDPAVWSVNAYVSHLADAAGIIVWRLCQIAERDRPALPNHDPDKAVAESHADECPAEDSLSQLTRSVNEFEQFIRARGATAWERVGAHSAAGEVRFADIAHDMAHELRHHAEDIRRLGRS